LFFVHFLPDVLKRVLLVESLIFFEKIRDSTKMGRVDESVRVLGSGVGSGCGIGCLGSGVGSGGVDEENIQEGVGVRAVSRSGHNFQPFPFGKFKSQN